MNPYVHEFQPAQYNQNPRDINDVLQLFESEQQQQYCQSIPNEWRSTMTLNELLRNGSKHAQ